MGGKGQGWGWWAWCWCWAFGLLSGLGLRGLGSGFGLHRFWAVIRVRARALCLGSGLGSRPPNSSLWSIESFKIKFRQLEHNTTQHMRGDTLEAELKRFRGEFFDVT